MRNRFGATSCDNENNLFYSEDTAKLIPRASTCARVSYWPSLPDPFRSIDPTLGTVVLNDEVLLNPTRDGEGIPLSYCKQHAHHDANVVKGGTDYRVMIWLI